MVQRPECAFMWVKTSINMIKIAVTVLPAPVGRIARTSVQSSAFVWHRLKLMIARDVGLEIPEKLANKVLPRLGRE